ncbi:hypothetical protein LIER_40502 [Lithospermum erythrorhizon]|uniref:Uncharacterized protein n=1 Tax=Lithospermum erythrorhizon TaxID=34254 RepID=A0AAV3QYL2_LITER
MAARNPSSSYKLWNSMVMFYRNKIQLMSSSGTSNDMCSPSLTPLVPEIYGAPSAGLRSLSFSPGPSSQNLDELNRINKEGGSTQRVPPLVPPATSRFNVLNWVKCLIGSMLSILIPFLKPKWENLHKLEGKVEMAVEEVEEVVECCSEMLTDITNRYINTQNLRV